MCATQSLVEHCEPSFSLFTFEKPQQGLAISASLTGTQLKNYCCSACSFLHCSAHSHFLHLSRGSLIVPDASIYSHIMLHQQSCILFQNYSHIIAASLSVVVVAKIAKFGHTVYMVIITNNDLDGMHKYVSVACTIATLGSSCSPSQKVSDSTKGIIQKTFLKSLI